MNQRTRDTGRKY